MIELKNDRLTVEIAKPRTVYTGQRFDATGWVAQITLDGLHTFCSSESGAGNGKGTGGVGICNEFGLTEAIGYDEIGSGEWFPKLGVGILKRPDNKPYSFMLPHEVRPYPIDFSADETSVEFRVHPVDCRGYAAALTKRLSINDDQLQIAYRLDNTGSRAIHTHEYCHNFLLIARHPVGPEYSLHHGCPMSTPPRSKILKTDAGETQWLSLAPADDHYYFRCDNPPSNGRTWRMLHTPTGLSVSEQTDRPWMRFALWGGRDVISPEAFIAIDLDPGQTMTWTRTFKFGDGKVGT